MGKGQVHSVGQPMNQARAGFHWIGHSNSIDTPGPVIFHETDTGPTETTHQGRMIT
jgi:hypothetical protein